MILCGEICNFVNVTLILLNMTNIANAQNPFLRNIQLRMALFLLTNKNEHYEPAIREGISRQAAEIGAIVNNPEAPTFANTILAYENQESYSIGLPPYSATCAVLKPMMTCRRLPRR